MHGSGNPAIQTVSCPPEVLQGLIPYRDSLSAFLPERVVALTLYGSLASGRYNGKTSDVHVLAVLARPMRTDG